MKTKVLIFFMLFHSIISFCQNSEDIVWKSGYSELQLKFEDDWQIIKPYVDSENKLLFGIINKKDNLSVVVKITNDIPKEQLSDEVYEDAIKDQMLKGNNENKLLVHDKIDFKGLKFTRLTFLMKIKFGYFVSTDYTYRNGKKIISIQFSFPKTFAKNYGNEIPIEIEKILSNMKF